MGITLRLVDNYEVRNEILALLQRHSTTWFDAALTRAPTELQATLQVKAGYRRRPLNFVDGFLSQKYLAVTQVTSSNEATGLGTSLAAHFAREISSNERDLSGIFRLTSVCAWRAYPPFGRFFVCHFCLEAGSYQGPSFADCVEVILQWGDRWAEVVPAHWLANLLREGSYRSKNCCRPKRTGETTSTYISDCGAGSSQEADGGGSDRAPGEAKLLDTS